MAALPVPASTQTIIVSSATVSASPAASSTSTSSSSGAVTSFAGIIESLSGASSIVTSSTKITKSELPLTTTFTPPASCLSSANSFTDGYSLAPTQLPSCYPSPGPLLTYSPAICPSGYTVGLMNINLYRSAAQTSVYATETEFRCCPSLLTYDIESTICRTIINQPTTTGSPPVLVTPTNPFNSEIIWASIPAAAAPYGTAYFSSVIQEPFNLNSETRTVQAPVFYARLQSTDSAVSSSWASILGSSTSSTDTGTGSRDKSRQGGLGGGAIAGIVIGAIAALALLLLLVWFMLRRRKRTRTAKDTLPDEIDGNEKASWNGQELEGKSKSPPELDGNKIAEMQDSNLPPSELQASHLVELPGSIPGQKDSSSIIDEGDLATSPRHWVSFEEKLGGARTSAEV